MTFSYKKYATTTISAVVIAGAIALLYKRIQNISLHEILDAIHSTSLYQILTCVVLTFFSFICLAIYELLAVKVGAEQKISARITLFTGASANAVANTLGFHALTGGTWRYRVYSAMGLTFGDLVRIMSIASAGIGLSFVSVTALALVANRESSTLFHLTGVGLLLILCGIFYWTKDATQKIRLGKWSLTIPDFRITLQLMLVGIVEMTCAIGALYTLMPLEIKPDFAQFTLFYIGAIFLGILSSTPGGIGVFEATIISALGPNNRAAIIAALLLYRIIYNLLPFATACIGIFLFETRKKYQFEAG